MLLIPLEDLITPDSSSKWGEDSPARKDPDAILHDKFSNRVFTFNGGGTKDATAIDASTGKVAIAIGAGAVAASAGAYIIYKKVSKSSGKERATDAPSWASQYSKEPGEGCGEFAARILLDKYGVGDPRALRRGATSEYSQIKKACERGGL